MVWWLWIPIGITIWVLLCVGVAIFVLTLANANALSKRLDDQAAEKEIDDLIDEVLRENKGAK
jgi:flagellar basal body-associated protein FliL